MLITTLDELIKYIPSSYIKSFSVIENFISNAEVKEIKSMLGSELYTDLLSAYEGSGDDETYTNLLPYVQRPLANFAYYNAVPILDIVHTESGFGVVSTSGTAPASANRVAAFRKGVLKSAYDGIEALLQYLEENKSSFPKWVSSSSYSDQHDHLIPTARDFHKYANINESRFIYLKILPKMAEIEDFRIKAHVSEGLFDALIEELKGSSDLSAEDAKLVSYLKPAVANFTMAESLDLIATSIYAEGLQLQYSIGTASVAGEERLAKLRTDFNRSGTFYLAKARGYILSNIDSFPEYKASDLYNTEVTKVKPMYENDEDSHIASFGGGVG